MKIYEKSMKNMNFHDFPRFLGKSGMDLMHPPKLCASLVHSAQVSDQLQDSDFLGLVAKPLLACGGQVLPGLGLHITWGGA